MVVFFTSFEKLFFCLLKNSLCGRNHVWCGPKSIICKSSNNLYGMRETLEIRPRNGLSSNPEPVCASDCWSGSHAVVDTCPGPFPLDRRELWAVPASPEA